MNPALGWLFAVMNEVMRIGLHHTEYHSTALLSSLILFTVLSSKGIDR